MIRHVASALLIAVVAACGPGGVPSPSATQLQVYAAASLRMALDAAGAAYEAGHPGVSVTISTDSSAALAAKIGQGAPADVFLAADTANPQRLVDAGLAAGAVLPFAATGLTVIIPADNPAGIETPADLGREGVIVIAAAEGVPIQAYTAQWLERVAGLPGYGAGFAERYAANVASREDNVGAVVTKVALGEGDAAVVYATDAWSQEGVTAVPIPDAENVAVTYGGVIVGSSPNRAAAAGFLDWLADVDGQAVLASFGFVGPAS